MPIGEAGIAAIYGGAQILGMGANAYAQGRMNRASRQFAQEQAAVQNDRNIANWKMMNEYNEGLWEKQNAYDQAMRDNQRMHELGVWERENEYNSPREQMQRFQEAGLNPHMIAGSSNAMGGSISTSTMDTNSQQTGSPDGASQATWNPKAPTFDFHSGIMGMVDIKTKSAQKDLISEQANLTKKEGDLIAAKTLTELTAGRSGEFDLGLKTELRETSVQAQKEMLRKLTADADFTRHQDRRSEESLKITASEAKARIDLLQKQAKTEEQRQELNRIEMIIKTIEAKYGGGASALFGRILEALPKKWSEVKKNPDGTYQIWWDKD